MGVLDRIADIEKEMSRTQKNKATMSHLCRLIINLNVGGQLFTAKVSFKLFFDSY